MSNSTRESYIFYRSFRDAINEASKEDKLQIYEAIANYALDRKEPELSGIAKALWLAFKPQLDANWQRYENGSKGGAPKGSANNPSGRRGGKTTEDQPRTNRDLTKNKPNVNVNENNNENIEDIKRTAKRFTPPSFDEVSEYIMQKGYAISAQAFIDYYDSTGWMRGRNKMKNWKAAVSSWNSRDDDNKASTVNTNQNPQKITESYELL